MKRLLSFNSRRLVALACFLLPALVCSAAVGNLSNMDNWRGYGTPDYSWSADALYEACVELELYLFAAVNLCNAVAAVLSIVSATQIYIKMNNGEDGVMKSIHMLIGSILFLLAANVVFPAIFGFSFNPDAWSFSVRHS